MAIILRLGDIVVRPLASKRGRRSNFLLGANFVGPVFVEGGAFSKQASYYYDILSKSSNVSVACIDSKHGDFLQQFSP